jgi:2-polyprenyl-3-methyl-5-hydroxy-6-metoxy-1,4-benzoquinol methylase
MLGLLKHGVNRVLQPLNLHVSKRSTFVHLLDRGLTLSSEAAKHYDTRYSPLANFLHVEATGLTKRRQEHLASLGLDLVKRTVLEVGAGIGEHTTFFLDRGCQVLSTEGRADNLAILRDRYARFGYYQYASNLEIAYLDLEHPPAEFQRQFDIVYCYGTLYHVQEPEPVLRFLARCCTGLLLLETSVSFGWDEAVVRGCEDKLIVSQSIHGYGCHPTRPWVYQRLKESFPFVYMPRTQPYHDQFPLDWMHPVQTPNRAVRAVFIASRTQLQNPLLLEGIPQQQQRG